MSSNTSLGARALFAACLSLALSQPASGEEGKTIFADSRKGTLSAMKGIVKAIGVGKQGGCLFCHVKEGGKPVFAKDTANKRLVRMMKIGFVDSLAVKGKVELELTESEHRTLVVAEYRAEGEDAGIHLSATLMQEHGDGEHDGKHGDGEHGDGEHAGEKEGEGSHEPRTFYGKVALPAEGEPITCMTCHKGELHFLSKAD